VKYDLDNIYNEDSYKAIKDIPDNSIDLIILDPPYEIDSTTCVAAKELGRRYIGFEIDEEYYKIAKDRLNGVTANGQTSMFTDFSKLDI